MKMRSSWLKVHGIGKPNAITPIGRPSSCIGTQASACRAISRVRAPELRIERRQFVGGADEHGGTLVERVGEGHDRVQRNQPVVVGVPLLIPDVPFELEIEAALVDQEETSRRGAEGGHSVGEQCSRDLFQGLLVGDPRGDPLQPRERLVKNADARLGFGTAGQAQEKDLGIERARVAEEATAVSRSERKRRRRLARRSGSQQGLEAMGFRGEVRERRPIQSRDARSQRLGAGDVGREDPP